MATPRNRQYRAGKGSIDLGSILLGALGGTGVGEVAPIPPEDLSVPGFNYDERPLDPNAPTKFGVKDKGKDYTGKGQELANRANIESIQAEEQAKRHLKTKESEIPIDVAREKALTDPLVDRARLLADLQTDKEVQRRLKIDPIDLQKTIDTHRVDLDAELARRKAIDPLDIEKSRKQNTMAILTGQGITPEPENEEKYRDLVSGINLSKAAQSGTRSIAEDVAGEEKAKQLFQIESGARPYNIKAGINQSKFNAVKSDQDLEVQPDIFKQYKETIPGMAEAELTRREREKLMPVSPESSVFNIQTKAPAFRGIGKPMDELIRSKMGGGLKTGLPTSKAAIEPQEGDIIPDPDDPNMVIVIMGGQKVRVPKGTP